MGSVSHVGRGESEDDEEEEGGIRRVFVVRVSDVG